MHGLQHAGDAIAYLQHPVCVHCAMTHCLCGAVDGAVQGLGAGYCILGVWHAGRHSAALQINRQAAEEVG
jgi:hypothetical protein